MTEKPDSECVECHARVVGSVEARVCPACGGALIPAAKAMHVDGLVPRTVDHRGIVLPPRHAVGGIITPR
jgi:hypothetical protein